MKWMNRPFDRSIFRSGFTLTEVMITLALVALIIALGFPTMYESFRKREAMEASKDTVSLLRRARYDSATNNRAYVLIFNVGSNYIKLLRSPNNMCQAVNPNQTPVAVIDYGRRYENVKLAAIAPAAAGRNGVCIKPDGRVLNMSNGRPFLPAPGNNLQAGMVVIDIQLTDGGGTASGNPHKITLPYNGIVRMVQ